jgi:microcystin-dependent protein
VSKPIGVAKTSTVLQFINMRGSVVGGANLRTTINLANNATTTIQNVSAYEAGELTGWIGIQATTPLKFFISVKFSKNGAGTDYNVSYQASGDTPPAGFAISVTSAGIIQATLPSVTGFGSASINYSLNAPAVGVTLPLSINSNLIVGDTNPVGTLLDYAGSAAPSNYLMCDGRSLSTTGTFAALYAVIGYAYGGSGSSFNIPDFRGRFARYNDNMGSALGAANRDVGARNADKSQGQATAKNGLSAATGPASNSSWTTGVLGSTGSNNSTSWSGHGLIRGGNLSGNSADGSFPGQDHTHSTTITGDTETRPINISCNKIIKY